MIGCVCACDVLCWVGEGDRCDSVRFFAISKFCHSIATGNCRSADPMELQQLHVGVADWKGQGGADPPASPRGGTQPGLARGGLPPSGGLVGASAPWARNVALDRICSACTRARPCKQLEREQLPPVAALSLGRHGSSIAESRFMSEASTVLGQHGHRESRIVPLLYASGLMSAA